MLCGFVVVVVALAVVAMVVAITVVTGSSEDAAGIITVLGVCVLVIGCNYAMR